MNERVQRIDSSSFAEVLDEQFLDAAVARIRGSTRDAEVDAVAKLLIHDFVQRVTNEIPQSPITLRWLRDVLMEILEHDEDPRIAIGLKPRPSHRPRASDEHAVDVQNWIALAMRRGFKKSEAIRAAAEAFGYRDLGSIRRLLRVMPAWVPAAPEGDQGVSFEDLLEWGYINPPEQMAAYFARQGRALPPKRSARKTGRKS